MKMETCINIFCISCVLVLGGLNLYTNYINHRLTTALTRVTTDLELANTQIESNQAYEDFLYGRLYWAMNDRDRLIRELKETKALLENIAAQNKDNFDQLEDAKIQNDVLLNDRDELVREIFRKDAHIHNLEADIADQAKRIEELNEVIDRLGEMLANKNNNDSLKN